MNQFPMTWQIRFLVGILAACLASSLNGQESQLGRVEFPTSGGVKAQQHFLRGLAALHSFWYEEALDAFREASRIEPDFMMAYWGEAMTYNHPLWSEQDTAAGRTVIARIKENSKLSRRELAYLNAVKLLYGEGDKRARDNAYSAAMERIYKDYPNDLDAAAFYALSLLGLVNPQEKSYRLQARAGAIALDVYQKNPNHPGAAHYIIHAFDDPDHAVLALPAARRYASIAPEAHHARHMPSHIFLQLGMWPEAAASNQSAWEASEQWMRRKNLATNVRDYHSLHWLLYVYLQQGRYKQAEELLILMKKTMSESTYDNKLRPRYYETIYASMAAAFIVETERWELTKKFFPEPPSSESTASAQTATSGHGHGGAQLVSSGEPATVRSSNPAQRLPLFMRRLAGAFGGSAEKEMKLVDDEISTGGDPQERIGELEVAAVVATQNQKYERAAALMKEATMLEEEMRPPSGPPGLIKPSHELFGELMLQAGKPEVAKAQFKIALLRQPNRARSLLGAARAAAKSGDQQAATSAYGRLLEEWQEADEGLPELGEAQEYVKQLKP